MVLGRGEVRVLALTTINLSPVSQFVKRPFTRSFSRISEITSSYLRISVLVISPSSTDNGMCLTLIRTVCSPSGRPGLVPSSFKRFSLKGTTSANRVTLSFILSRYIRHIELTLCKPVIWEESITSPMVLYSYLCLIHSAGVVFRSPNRIFSCRKTSGMSPYVLATLPLPACDKVESLFSDIPPT
mgnify:CR=1 FL=1